MHIVLPFDTDDPEFTRGVEIGMVYEALTRLPPEAVSYERTIHTSNLEMLLRVADSEGWTLRPRASVDETGESYDEWTVVVLERCAHPKGDTR